jgi:hypothetical protein
MPFAHACVAHRARLGDPWRQAIERKERQAAVQTHVAALNLALAAERARRRAVALAECSGARLIAAACVPRGSSGARSVVRPAAGRGMSGHCAGAIACGRALHYIAGP